MPDPINDLPCINRPTPAARGPIESQLIEKILAETNWTMAEAARLSGVSPRTIKGWIERGTAEYKKLERFARISGYSLDKFRVNHAANLAPSAATVSDSTDANVRDLSGHWEIRGSDIVVPGHFEYQCPPKKLSGQITIRHSAKDHSELLGEGHDHDNDTIEFRGRLFDNMFVRGTYDIHNPRMLVRGTLFMQYKLDGKHIYGFYLGQETGHNTLSGVILGQICLTLVERS